ncbi:MAG: hypothetical protein LC777_05035 [Actinobacteria bacterium]|nr:hypothetical protein [Actinomycetota bacterium]
MLIDHRVQDSTRHPPIPSNYRGTAPKYAEVDPESGLINLTGGGVDVFGAEHFPIQFMQPFVLQLRFDEAEAGQLHQVVMRVLDSQLRPIGEAASIEITPKLGQYHASGWAGIFAVAGAARLQADAPGTHSLEIRIDGEHAGDIPYQMVLASASN